MTQGATNEHSTEIESSFLTPGWTATCACGWRGKLRPTSVDAQIDASDHHASVPGVSE